MGRFLRDCGELAVRRGVDEVGLIECGIEHIIFTEFGNSDAVLSQFIGAGGEDSGGIEMKLSFRDDVEVIPGGDAGRISGVEGSIDGTKIGAPAIFAAHAIEADVAGDHGIGGRGRLGRRRG